MSPRVQQRGHTNVKSRNVIRKTHSYDIQGEPNLSIQWCKVTFIGCIWCDVALVLTTQKIQNFAWGVQDQECVVNLPSECLSTTEPEDKIGCTYMNARLRQQML